MPEYTYKCPNCHEEVVLEHAMGTLVITTHCGDKPMKRVIKAANVVSGCLNRDNIAN